MNDRILRPSQSESASPTVLVKKKTGELRICIDYRALNNATIRDSYPLPIIEDFMYRLRNAAVFTTKDAADGYFLVKMTEKYKH